jgi:hypothetical protein
MDAHDPGPLLSWDEPQVAAFFSGALGLPQYAPHIHGRSIIINQPRRARR